MQPLKTDSGAAPVAAFRIRGMDCAEEVAVLKRELRPLVGDEERLSFDILQGKLTVATGGRPVAPDEVVRAVARTGMRAVPWEAHLAAEAARAPKGFLRGHARLVYCLASGAALVAAFAGHAWSHGWADALWPAESGHAIPRGVGALYLVAIVAGARYVAPRAIHAARRLRPDMNLLMTVAVAGALVLGEWFEAATIAFLFALALLLESWSVGRAREAVKALMDLSPKTARYICPHDGAIEEKPVGETPVGAVVLVRPGERIPLDGVVQRGESAVNQAPITGESMPVPKSPGDEVFAGTINGDGAIEFRATKQAEDTTLARIIRMIEEAQSRRAPSEQWVDRFARTYTPAMMGLALLIGVAPSLVLGNPWTDSIYRALVVLVIACPCALVISTPVSVVAGLAAAARAGVLVKGGAYLEAPARLRAVALDKTGTLTRGEPEVREVIALSGHTQREVLARAAAIEAHSEHPIARAVLRRAAHDGLECEPADEFRALQGRGATAKVDGRAFWIASHRYLHEIAPHHETFHEQAEALEDAGHSVVAVGNDDHVCGYLAVADAVRPRSADAVQALRKAGIEHIAMLTGDNEGTARAVAEAVGVDAFHAELLPEDKVRTIERLRDRFGAVAMVGDGVNDAPAMAASSLGIAMGAVGTDAAIETADIALMSDDLERLSWLIRHSRRALAVIKTNIAVALGLKLLFIALALAGAATLWMAIAADMGASLLVIFNGLRLLDGRAKT